MQIMWRPSPDNGNSAINIDTQPVTVVDALAYAVISQQGPQGVQGLKGDKGDTGAQGPISFNAGDGVSFSGPSLNLDVDELPLA